MFYNFVAERTGEKLHNSVNFQNFIYHFKDLTKDMYFNWRWRKTWNRILIEIE